MFKISTPDLYRLNYKTYFLKYVIAFLYFAQ